MAMDCTFAKMNGLLDYAVFCFVCVYILPNVFQLRYYVNLARVLPSLVISVTWNNLSRTRQRALKRQQELRQQQNNETAKDK
jgi:cytochrome c biogenesis protein CcdA